MRYRLVVVAPTANEVIKYAGGLVFDRGMAGWDVTVLVQDDPTARALQILGAQTVDFESGFEWRGFGFHPQAVVTAGSLYERDDRVREGVQRILGEGETEVTLWGDSLPDELDSRIGMVRHRLSVAARAFKAQALAAASLPTDSAGLAEVFRCSRSKSWDGLSDLVPA
ncbi:hypothetical protein [Nocardia sp. 348MFTsu5.1]|uniref:hypothetical protein n=1 Tax=Nocardia sp. 348MFTsu5.1 TaxID=1172185 RepID=UPI00035CE669|nr:hypothetical protein [Nocardia sp. 348MFTsu5.1]